MSNPTWQPICLQGLLSRDFDANHFDVSAPSGHDGLVFIGGCLSKDWLLESYSKGIFPWFEERPYRWYSPPWRMVLYPDEFKVSKSFKKFLSQNSYRVDYDQQFKQVINHCAKVRRDEENRTWITKEMITAYQKLFQLGVAHSVEVMEGKDLVGGLYGVSLGKFFFGESMFSLKPNTSKLALFHLCQFAQKNQLEMIDCQIYSDHLSSLGARPMEKKKFLEELSLSNQHPTLKGDWSQFK